LTNNETAVYFGSYQNLLPYWRLLSSGCKAMSSGTSLPRWRVLNTVFVIKTAVRTS